MAVYKVETSLPITNEPSNFIYAGVTGKSPNYWYAYLANARDKLQLHYQLEKQRGVVCLMQKIEDDWFPTLRERWLGLKLHFKSLVSKLK